MGKAHTEDIYAEKISLGEKISYGLGDTSCNIIFTLVSSLAVYFYTNVMGVSPLLASSVVGISCIFDGISDAIIGVLVDRTKSKHGKTRPWILWMMIPYGVTGVLLFTCPPNASEMFKAVYIFVTYNLAVTVVYTALNLPYGALSALMTRSQMQRTELNIYRMSMAPLGAMLVTACTLPAVNALGGGQRAWIIVVSALGIVSSVLLWFTFRYTKERVVEPPTATGEKLSTRVSIQSMLMNKYWWMVIVIFLGWSLSLTIRGMTTTYYAQYHLGDEKIMSLLTTLETLPNIPLAILSYPMVKRWGKRNVSLAGALIALAGQCLVVIEPTNVMMLNIAALLRGIGAGPVFALAFSFVADTVEYGQWRTGIRNEGLLFSAALIGYKVGTAATTGIIGYLLEIAGYNGTLAVQSASAYQMIGNLYIIGPFVAWITMTIVLSVYRLDKEYPQIMEDLKNGKYHPKAKFANNI